MNKQIIRFIGMGIVNTIFYYLLYACFIYLGFHYILSVLLATLFGVFFSFQTFSKYVFENKNKKLIFKFLIVYGVLYLTNIGLISILQVFLNDYYTSGLIATLCCAVLSFLLNKFYVFYK